MTAAMQESITTTGTLRRLAIHGAAASTLVTIASWGIGWFPRNQFSPLARTGFFIEFRTEAIGVIACIVLMAVGLAWMTRCWLLLRPLVAPIERVSTRQVARLLTAWCAPLLLAFPILSRDVYAYLAQGRLLHAGRSPYAEGVSTIPGWFDAGADGLWAQSLSPYGPIFVSLSRFIHFISGGIPEIGVLMLRVAAIAGVIGCFHYLKVLCAKLGYNTDWTLWAVLCSPLFLLTMVGGAHNDGLMLAAIFAAFARAADGRWVRASFALSVAVAIKPIALILLPFVGLLMLAADARRTERLVMWVKLGALTMLWLLIYGAASGLWFGWLPAMFTAGSAAFPYAPVGLLGWLGALATNALGGNGDLVQTVVVLVFELCGLLLVFKLALAERVARPLRAAAWALSAVVLLAPIIQPWYILWLFALFALDRDVSWRAERLMVQISSLILLAVFVDQLSIEQWHVIWLMRVFAALLGLLLFLYLLYRDRAIAGWFNAPCPPD
ncbi:polyprenol phosphomannose-dependent alpha 1,6 mannosyltransferase MptB [Glutamicibacter endophyticus]|uniref:polyprenol phosphomannose-dependent alpha 1,6 mannosyltransferase MptB n=1 Tax=Glutamicibacter endophyticus TaxID=1522174 RepID=UPI003AF1306F